MADNYIILQHNNNSNYYNIIITTLVCLDSIYYLLIHSFNLYYLFVIG